ncbi:orotate phosphoribosyltransferase [Oleiagrimonas sp. MCCC 1A03011]|nr:orotate phosphoribosyltransferase [Oleiagrimonas sp. MCCC 1A03011]
MNTPSDQMPPTPPPAPPPAAEPASGDNTAAVSPEQRQWAMFAHLSAFVGLVIPFGNIIGPLVIWLIKKDTMPFVDDQGKEALNFQITVALAMLASFLLMLVLIGFLLVWIIPLVALVFVIIATIKANEGVYYRYPWTLRLVK